MLGSSKRSFVFEGIGTRWVIDIEDPIDDIKADYLLQRMKARIEQFDRAYSRFRSDSLITQFSERAGAYVLPEDAAPMMRLYEQLYRITKGLMTPLVGQLLVDAGYDAMYSLQPKELCEPPTWEEAIVFEPSTSALTVKRPVVLDVGAMGKGYLIDLVSGILIEEGMRSFCVEAGGDMLQRHARSSPLRVGLEHPEDTTQVIGVVDLLNASLCGSAGNRRAWSTFHHIMNPKTLTSPRDILAVWAVASTTMLADAMTTALFFVSPDVLERYYSFEYLVMYADRSIKASRGFPAELFIEPSS